MLPRAAVLYMTVAVLECAALCGAGPSLHTEVDSATRLLEDLAEEWGPDAPDDSGAKALAHTLRGKLPVVAGSGPTIAPARRWKTQLNENSSVAAFASELPEADHNEICGWARGTESAPLAAVLLADSDQHPRVRRRIELTAAEVERAGASTQIVESRGETRLERVLSLVLLGDLTSVYLAVLDGVDPSSMEPIERLKAALAGAD